MPVFAWERADDLLSQIFAGATALALIAGGLLEIVLHGDRRFNRIFLIKPEDVQGGGWCRAADAMAEVKTSGGATAAQPPAAVVPPWTPAAITGA